MKIRFSEHISHNQRELILREVVGICANGEPIGEDWYFITMAKPTRYAFAVEFLREEQRRGNLELDESFMR